MTNKDTIYEEFEYWIGHSEGSSWTEYSAQLSATTTLYNFSKKDWTRLDEDIIKKPEYWQQRCISALGHDRTEIAIEIIKKTLESSDYRDVKILAIYELDWTDTTIEQRLEHIIRGIIDSLPEDEIEPELKRALAKSISSQT